MLIMTASSSESDAPEYKARSKRIVAFSTGLTGNPSTFRILATSQWVMLVLMAMFDLAERNTNKR